MNITFFVGNGFDISQGLETTYKKFLEWYLSFDSSDSDIKKFKIETIEKDLETWADAEVAFGGSTNLFSVETLSILQKCIDDFSRELSNYLKEQTRYLEIDYNNTAKDVIAGIKKVNELLRPESERQVSAVLLANSSENWTYNFINFNYTSLLDQAIETIGVENQDFAVHKDVRGSSYKDIVGKVIHIHGTTENEMVFGVDNESQILNEELRDNTVIKKSLIKPEINRRLKTGIAQNVKSCIDNSSIIVIYGMSLGSTDAFWWKYIAKWLKSNLHGQLIIFTYQEKYDPLLARSFMDTEDSIEDRFFSYSSFDETVNNELKKRIHIIINKKLFQVTFKSEEDKLRQVYKNRLLLEKTQQGKH